MRGKGRTDLLNELSNRITPAYAGKSQSLEFQRRYYQDHPRLCGEKGYRGYFQKYKLGSPPPMRGKGIR